MEPKEIYNMYEKCYTLFISLTKSLTAVQNEVNYFRMAAINRNEKDILNSAMLMGIRVSNLCKEYHKVVEISKSIITEVELPNDVLTVCKLQLKETNESLIKLSEFITYLIVIANSKKN